MKNFHDDMRNNKNSNKNSNGNHITKIYKMKSLQLKVKICLRRSPLSTNEYLNLHAYESLDAINFIKMNELYDKASCSFNIINIVSINYKF